MSGFTLMQKARPTAELDHQRDPTNFARELNLARDAGFIEFDDRIYSGQRLADAKTDAWMWLQQIRDVSLTLRGRDRARNRFMVVEPPDPNEDDGRQIASSTLDEIARDLAATYTADQLPQFLYESGIPEAALQVQATSTSAYTHAVLLRMLGGGAAARRSLREFLGRWLSESLPTGPSLDAKRRIISQLRRQGWHVADQRLRIGPHQVVDEPVQGSSKESQFGALHVRVRTAAGRFLSSELLEVAAFEAMKAVTNRVKAMSGLDLDGSALMAKAFADNHPLIDLADRSTESGRNVQAGFRFLFMGAVQAIRNPDAHEPLRPLSSEEAMERLALASLLMRVLDGAKAS